MRNGDKAIGPDGFNMKFLQEFWHVIKSDVVELFRAMHDFGTFVRFLNSIFLEFITKKEGANDIRDFKPISLVDCIYKFITIESF